MTFVTSACCFPCTCASQTYDTILKKLQTKVHQARNAPLQMQGRETCAAMPEHQPPVPAGNTHTNTLDVVVCLGSYIRVRAF